MYVMVMWFGLVVACLIVRGGDIPDSCLLSGPFHLMEFSLLALILGEVLSLIET